MIVQTNKTRFRALDHVGSTQRAWTLAKFLLAAFAAAAVAMAITPWRQNVPVSGRIVAFDPASRRQFIEAPVDGRVVRWFVVEGQRVRKGEPLVLIADNDPILPQRLQAQRSAVEAARLAAQSKIRALERKMANLESTRDRSVEAARAKTAAAEEKVRAAERALDAARAAELAAQLNSARQQRLFERGLTSRRNLELAQMARDQALAAVEKAQAERRAESGQLRSLAAELRKALVEGEAGVDEARASRESALAEERKAAAELAKIDVELARIRAQRVVAPADGLVLRVQARLGGEMVKQGDVLLELVPESTDNVAELWVDGNDVPLIFPGRKARLQFEGWPALQFSGWPSIAIGAFGGEVRVVDAADDGQGRFRVLVGPDPDDQPWPEPRYLRQGVRVQGWILLDQVSLGYELWRQFNGFPPATSAPLRGDGK